MAYVVQFHGGLAQKREEMQPFMIWRLMLGGCVAFWSFLGLVFYWVL